MMCLLNTSGKINHFSLSAQAYTDARDPPSALSLEIGARGRFQWHLNCLLEFPP